MTNLHPHRIPWKFLSFLIRIPFTVTTAHAVSVILKQQVHTALSGIPYPIVDSHYRDMEAQKASKPIEIGAIKDTKLFSFRRGNVQIKVIHQDELVVGKVSSHCIVQASKVWESLIFDPLTKHEKRDKKLQSFSFHFFSINNF
jgi:hypothetical protein